MKPGNENESLELHETIEPDSNIQDNYTTTEGTRSDAVVLMHTPMGLRICFNIAAQCLEIWISPQAKQSIDARMRNFSNRDDYTCLFDRIALPGLAGQRFGQCRYDPFYSVLEYENQSVHLLGFVDKPGLALWFDKPEIVDIKSDKQDTVTSRRDDAFVVRHPDRFLTLEFAAVAGVGSGAFQHQKNLEAGRSAYCRLVPEAGQVLLIGGELETQSPGEQLDLIAAMSGEELIELNERAIAPLLEEGRAVFKDRPDWQKQYDLNQRVMLSCQDFGGAIPAALRAVYYLIWHMDGALTAASAGYTGWQSYLRRWARFEASNPTQATGPQPGRYFGQLVNRKISKQEEWGLFWTAWSLFASWSQTGSDDLMTEAIRKNLLDAVDWIERVCFDCEARAFGTWYQGENPFKDSWDFAADEAVGAPMNTPTPSFEGKAILRSYGFEMNLMMYNVYLMLSAMWDDPAGKDDFLNKAEGLVDFLARCRTQRFSRRLLLEDGCEALDPMAPRYPPGVAFLPDLSDLVNLVRKDPKHDLSPVLQGREAFAHQLLSNLAVQDQAIFGSENLEKLLELFLPQIARSGKVLKMPGTLIEDVNCPDGSYHDNRPQLFATGLLQYCMTGRGVQRLPMGIAFRANDILQRIEGYRWLGRDLTLHFQGRGMHVAHVRSGDRTLGSTLQIPDRMARQSRDIAAILTNDAPDRPQLIYSTMRLLEAEEQGGKTNLVFQAIGNNQAAFTPVPSQLEVTDAKGQIVEIEKDDCFGWHVVRFPGRGRFDLKFH